MKVIVEKRTARPTCDGERSRPGITRYGFVCFVGQGVGAMFKSMNRRPGG